MNDQLLWNTFVDVIRFFGCMDLADENAVGKALERLLGDAESAETEEEICAAADKLKQMTTDDADIRIILAHLKRGQ